MIFETPQRSNVSSNLLRGDDTIHKQRQKTTSFLDAHTTFKLHWPLTRPISKANIASFTGPLPGLKSQYCQLHWPLARPISKANIASFTGPLPGQSQKPILPNSFGCSLLVLLLHQLNPIFQEGQYILGDWNAWSQPVIFAAKLATRFHPLFFTFLVASRSCGETGSI